MSASTAELLTDTHGFTLPLQFATVEWATVPNEAGVYAIFDREERRSWSFRMAWPMRTARWGLNRGCSWTRALTSEQHLELMARPRRCSLVGTVASCPSWLWAYPKCCGWLIPFASQAKIAW